MALQTAATAKTASDAVAKHSMTYNEESINELEAEIDIQKALGKYAATIHLRREDVDGIIHILHSDSSRVLLEHYLAAVEERGYRVSYNSRNSVKLDISVGWS